MEFNPVHQMTAVLCLCRKAPHSSILSRSRFLERCGVTGRKNFAFWVRVGQAGGLLDERRQPTLLVPVWLKQGEHAQVNLLLNAWRTLPKDKIYRSRRQRLLDGLLFKPPLPPSYQRELDDLQMMGIVTGAPEHQPTALGKAALGFAPPLPPPPPVPWRIEGEHLRIPYPPDWAKFWEAERFFDCEGFHPETGFSLALSPASLRRARQRGTLAQIRRALADGLEGDLPAALQNQLALSSRIRPLPGLVLEFESSEELERTQGSPALGRSSNRRISSHHLLVSLRRAPRLLRSLERRGLLAESDLQVLNHWGGAAPETERKPGGLFPAADRAALLALALAAEELDLPVLLPDGILARLERSLTPALQRAAENRVGAILKALRPAAAAPDEGGWAPVPADRREALQRAIESGEAVEILYPGSDGMRRRRINPYRIERWGQHEVVTAYCHLRGDLRNFRLDRLEIAPPEPPSLLEQAIQKNWIGFPFKVHHNGFKEV